MEDKDLILWQHGMFFDFNTIEYFNEKYYKHIVFSYKKNFEKINGSNITCDSGWGCMIRCGQMILYQGIMMLMNDKNENLRNNFNDNNDSCFSIHKICSFKKKINIEINQWVGPNTMCHLIKNIVESSPYNEKMNIQIYNNELFINEKIYKPTLIFIPLRLGINYIEEKYYHILFLTFTYTNFVGFIGGSGYQAHYFIGIDNNLDLYYLDPHFTQDNNQNTSYKSKKIHKKNITELDPNIALCFNAKNQEDYNSICNIFSQDVNSIIEIKESNETKKFFVGEENDWLNIFIQ